MKSILEGLDLVKGNESTFLMAVPKTYAANLRTALIAALGVIESSGAYEQKYAELAADTGSINQDWRALDRLKRKASVAYDELETALEPFKVAGDDAKAVPK